MFCLIEGGGGKEKRILPLKMRSARAGMRPKRRRPRSPRDRAQEQWTAVVVVVAAVEGDRRGMAEAKFSIRKRKIVSRWSVGKKMHTRLSGSPTRFRSQVHEGVLFPAPGSCSSKELACVHTDRVVISPLVFFFNGVQLGGCVCMCALNLYS